MNATLEATADPTRQRRTSNLIVIDVARVVDELLELPPDAFARTVWGPRHRKAG